MTITRPLLSRCALLASCAVVATAADAQLPSSEPPMRMGRMGRMRPLMQWMHGDELSGSPTGPRPGFDDELRAVGKRLYGESCAVCHGANGDGKGAEAARLDPPPRDFTKGLYRLRSTPSGSLPADEDLFATIGRGIHGTAMLPWVSLTDEDRWALVAYIESLSPRFAREARGTKVSVPAAPEETAALRERGRAVYANAQCAACHGTSGHGDGRSAATLRDDDGRPIRPPDFARGRFKHGTGLRDIYLALRTGLDGTAMPSYADALSPSDTWALASCVRSFITPRAPLRGMGMMGGRDADPQERLGMMIDMPAMHSMGGMRMRR